VPRLQGLCPAESGHCARERGIGFKDPLVVEIEADRKTLTRRLVANAPVDLRPVAIVRNPKSGAGGLVHEVGRVGGGLNDTMRAPYIPGDRLWVKQALRRNDDGLVAYTSDGAEVVYPGTDATVPWAWKKPTLAAMYCPRWAARVFADVVNVRVERLQDITEADILAEGVTVPLAAKWTGIPWSSLPTLHHAWRALWDHINGDRPGAAWADNPWVWRIEFRRVTP
jgi:hypothetical protein